MDAQPIPAALQTLPVQTTPHDAVATYDTVASGVRTREITSGAEWNRTVLGLGDPDLRQGFEWGELRRGSAGRTLRYVVLDGANPVAAIAATVWHPLGSPYPFLYASRGPVLGPAGDRAWPGLLAAAADMAARTRAVFLRLSPAVPNDDPRVPGALARHGFVALPEEWTLWNAPRVVMSLDLGPSEAELKRRMRESTRLSLGRVQKAGGRVDIDVSREGVVRLHRLLVATGRRKGYPVRELAFFLDLQREYLTRGQGCLVIATHGGRDLAGVLGIRFGRRAHLLYSGVDGDDPQARKLRAGTAAHWELIRWAKNAGCQILDWGGAATGYPPRQEDPGFGIYDFKRGFGCSVSHLSAYHDLVFRAVLYRAFRWIETRCAPSLWHLRARLNA